MRRVLGFTALEWGILILIAGLLFTLAGHILGGGGGEPSGMVYSAMEETGALIEIDGTVEGYPAPDDPTALGSVSFTIRLLLGDMGGVDLDRTGFVFSDREGAVDLPRGTEGDAPPYWAITGRLDRPPFQSADEDDALESGEAFEILAVFPRPVAPGETFEITVTPPGGHPETVKRVVPSVVSGVTVLE
ncbi:hypothetical protein [Methanofollis fontis]|uniref:Flagellin n=1 Tax=Methanofollis fontis TaxID=2052832 RepID=A0A483CW50_9EURY|nr:hypothetical protein [Methanofollis fontis]TAJ45771.1 hypothetical protein CUJ86_03420 [Methanofollis fontis]